MGKSVKEAIELIKNQQWVKIRHGKEGFIKMLRDKYPIEAEVGVGYSAKKTEGGFKSEYYLPIGVNKEERRVLTIVAERNIFQDSTAAVNDVQLKTFLKKEYAKIAKVGTVSDDRVHNLMDKYIKDEVVGSKAEAGEIAYFSYVS